MAVLILYQCWYLGGPMVMFLAGLQGVPTELYEAAAIDGAGPIRRFVAISIPMISPLLLLATVLGLIGYLQDYLGPALVTGGGPMNATWVMSMEIYNNAITYTYPGHTAAACAEAMLLFLAALALTLAIFLGARRFVYDAGDGEGRL